MLLGWCYFHVVLLLANAALVINNNVENDQNGATDGILFTDVLKNISKANSVLQELIKNYAQLQKMYHTQSLEVDYSSDSEIDEVFKNANANYKRISRTRNNSDLATDLTIYPTTKKNFPGTEMIISEEDVENITEKSNLVDNENRSVFIENLQFPDSANPNKVQKKESNETFKDKSFHIDHKHSDEIKVPNYVFYDNLHPTNITKITTIKVKPEDSDHEHSEKIIVTDNVFANNLNNKSNTKMAKSKHNIAKLKKHKYKESIRQNDNEIYSTTKVNINAKNVQKILRTESFHEKTFWDEIVNKKPIKLKISKNIPSKFKRETRNQNNLGPKKTALVILTQNQESTQKSKEISSDSMTNEDEEINKELLKSRVLRTAYGEACIKVAVKKCYKALKLVIKSVCYNIKCKSSFKEKVGENSRKGCINEFQQNKSSAVYRGNEENEHESLFIDATRVGLQACFPFMETQTRLKNETALSTGEDKKVNILRDRFEKACERASIEKCRKACKFAFDKACKSYDCSKRKKKVIKKECKRKCKLSYKNKNKDRYSSHSSSSSDSSSSDSDSDSDSDSGSDSKSDDSLSKSDAAD